MRYEHQKHIPILEFPVDDYGNVIFRNLPFFSWCYSICTYGGFGYGIAEDMCQDV